jgi:hypothetical protein
VLTFATTTGPRIPQQERLITKGIRVTFYDPDAEQHSLPTYPYHWAPAGLYTIRQLRAKGLRPGGQPIAAQILWRHRKNIRVAFLYREDLAKPKRTATPAQLAAIAKALRARRTCPACGHLRDYYIPRSLGECNDCYDSHDRRAA